ncbi:MAG: NTP transferase domain-containing protein [bacterium]
MQIIIPMAGTGNRFMEAGYREPKPLIEVDGMPMIEHVVNLFPGETDFLFICNNGHLSNSGLGDTLRRIAPSGKIVGMETHKKGPVFSICNFIDLVSDDEVIVNYCDFGTYWDYADFLRHTRERCADGAIPSYRGFHPHMLNPTNYAFILDERQWMIEIREKEPFTDDRMSEYASNGTYYFKKGEYVRKFFPRLVDMGMPVWGEYYVSMVYNLLAEAGHKISIYEIQHMLQWGAPKDLEEYAAWSDYFREAARPRARVKIPGTMLMPMAGRGVRFSASDYDVPKPMAPVSGKPMFIQASASAPLTDRAFFVCLREHMESSNMQNEIEAEYPGAQIVVLNDATDGQASTARLGLEGVNPGEPVFIVACDNGAIWSGDEFSSLISDAETDVVIWTFRNNPCVLRDPRMYGWVSLAGPDRVSEVSVKTPISNNPLCDHAIVGAFYFSSAQLFLEGYELILSKDLRVNGELYIDSLAGELAKAGRVVKVFEVSRYVCWGTPDDLKTYAYWQSFFHKCLWHPYKLESDPMVSPDKAPDLAAKYSFFCQKYS